MKTSEILIATGIYIIIPILGLLYFVYLRDEMVRKKVQNPPVIELLLVFAIYGVLLITILTGLFWEWSLFASLGVIFTALPAPILMAFISVRLRLNSNLSRYHMALLNASWYYFLVFPVGLIVLFACSK